MLRLFTVISFLLPLVLTDIPIRTWLENCLFLFLSWVFQWLNKKPAFADWKVEKLRSGCQYVNIILYGKVWKSDSECIVGYKTDRQRLLRSQRQRRRSSCKRRGEKVNWLHFYTQYTVYSKTSNNSIVIYQNFHTEPSIFCACSFHVLVQL